jgi:GR25 family glycosyltransferase involved in LPS biosynthesis
MNIDKIFIINLEKRTDRKNEMMEELKKHNIQNYEFYNADRPSIQDIIQWNKNYCKHVVTSFRSAEKFLMYQIGCLGCLKSHLGVCKLALERKYKNVLILEDDTQFIHNLDVLAEFTSQIKNEYDMLYLCGSHTGVRETVSKNIVKTANTHTTGSYLITEDAMKYLVNNIQSYTKEVDVYYAEEIQQARWPNGSHRFNCLCTRPHITKQRAGFSDIQQAVVNYKLSE